MKRMGRAHREFYRICATDRRSPRDGRVIEELGTYDPHVSETDARCSINAERVDYWLSVGAQPSDAVRVLIKKYGTNGTHLKEMEEARERLKMPRQIPDVGPPAFVPKEPEPEAPPAAEGEPPAAESAEAPPAADADAKPAEQAEAAPAEGEAAEKPAEEPAAAAKPAEEAAAEAAPEATAEEAKSE